MKASQLSKVSYWDGKAENLGAYTCKIKAYTEFLGSEEALDVNLMKKCPAKPEYEPRTSHIPTNRLMQNFVANMKLCVVIALGQKNIMY